MPFGELILVAVLTIPPRETSFRDMVMPSYVRYYSDEIEISRLLRELEDLKNNENIEEYISRPTLRALVRAENKLQKVYWLMGDSFFRPSITPDGEGGIDLEWIRGERTVLIGCRAGDEQQDHIYYEDNNEYDSKEYSVAYLRNRLGWLISRT